MAEQQEIPTYQVKDLGTVPMDPHGVFKISHRTIFDSSDVIQQLVDHIDNQFPAPPKGWYEVKTQASPEHDVLLRDYGQRTIDWINRLLDLTKTREFIIPVNQMTLEEPWGQLHVRLMTAVHNTTSSTSRAHTLNLIRSSKQNRVLGANLVNSVVSNVSTASQQQQQQ